MITWLHVGTSPTVTETLPYVRNHHVINRTITCNAGLHLVPVPDVYVAVDRVATTDHDLYTLARNAQVQGTRLVTLDRDPQALKTRQVEHFDEFLTLQGHKPATRERWGQFRFSGPLCVEYAIRQGATHIIMVGCDGYKGGTADYFDGRKCFQAHQNVFQTKTMQVLKPQFQHLAHTWPEVQFIQYGKPCFSVSSPNWQVRWID